MSKKIKLSKNHKKIKSEATPEEQQKNEKNFLKKIFDIDCDATTCVGKTTVSDEKLYKFQPRKIWKTNSEFSKNHDEETKSAIFFNTQNKEDVTKLLSFDKFLTAFFRAKSGPKLFISHIKELSGFGVIAGECIKKDSLIGYYAGKKTSTKIVKLTNNPDHSDEERYDSDSTDEAISKNPDRELRKKLSEERTKQKQKYAYELCKPSKKSVVFLADRYGNAMRYINCNTTNPNAKADTKSDPIKIIALRDIQPFEQILINYGSRYITSETSLYIHSWENGQSYDSFFESHKFHYPSSFILKNKLSTENGKRIFIPKETKEGAQLPVLIAEKSTCGSGYVFTQRMSELHWHGAQGKLASFQHRLNKGDDPFDKDQDGISVLQMVIKKFEQEKTGKNPSNNQKILEILLYKIVEVVYKETLENLSNKTKGRAIPIKICKEVANRIEQQEFSTISNGPLKIKLMQMLEEILKTYEPKFKCSQNLPVPQAKPLASAQEGWAAAKLPMPQTIDTVQREQRLHKPSKKAIENLKTLSGSKPKSEPKLQKKRKRTTSSVPKMPQAATTTYKKPKIEGRPASRTKEKNYEGNKNTLFSPSHKKKYLAHKPIAPQKNHASFFKPVESSVQEKRASSVSESMTLWENREPN